MATFGEKKCLNIKSKDGPSGSEASCGFVVSNLISKTKSVHLILNLQFVNND